MFESTRTTWAETEFNRDLMKPLALRPLCSSTSHVVECHSLSFTTPRRKPSIAGFGRPLQPSPASAALLPKGFERRLSMASRRAERTDSRWVSSAKPLTCYSLRSTDPGLLWSRFVCQQPEGVAAGVSEATGHHRHYYTSSRVRRDAKPRRLSTALK